MSATQAGSTPSPALAHFAPGLERSQARSRSSKPSSIGEGGSFGWEMCHRGIVVVPPSRPSVCPRARDVGATGLQGGRSCGIIGVWQSHCWAWLYPVLLSARSILASS